MSLGNDDLCTAALLHNLLLKQPIRQTRTDCSPAPAKVAVVMRTKDRPILLRRAIASVTAQQFKNWHLYIVNDGGNPQAVEALVALYQEKLVDRVTVVHNDRSRGMEAASNQALAIAKGTCFVVHDDDDTWHPDFLAQTTAFLDRPEHTEMVGVATGCIKVYERIDGGQIIIEEQTPDPDVHQIADLEKLLVINRALPISLVFRMSLLEKLGGFVPELPVIGDFEFNIRALLIGEIGLIPDHLALYHMRRAPPSPAYGNSVIAGKDEHATYDRLLRNSILRRSVAQSPELLGVIQPVLHAISAAREFNAKQLNWAANALAENQKRSTNFLLGEIRGLLAQQENAVVTRVLKALQPSAAGGRSFGSQDLA